LGRLALELVLGHISLLFWKKSKKDFIISKPIDLETHFWWKVFSFGFLGV